VNDAKSEQRKLPSPRLGGPIPPGPRDSRLVDERVKGPVCVAQDGLPLMIESIARISIRPDLVYEERYNGCKTLARSLRLSAKTLTPEAPTSQANEHGEERDEEVGIAAGQRDQPVVAPRVVGPGSRTDRVGTRHCSSSRRAVDRGRQRMAKRTTSRTSGARAWQRQAHLKQLQTKRVTVAFLF
jgi:hypothetical protein